MAKHPPTHPDDTDDNRTPSDSSATSGSATGSTATSSATADGTAPNSATSDGATANSTSTRDTPTHNTSHGDAPSDTPNSDTSADDLRVSRNPLLRALWFGLGLLMTALGFIGAFLPVMPTTVFLLLAAFFFARSSPKFYRWLLDHPQFGGLIRDWRAGRGLTLRAKITAVSLIVVTVGSSALFFVPSLIGKLILAAVGIGVSSYLITRPTKPASQDG